VICSPNLVILRSQHIGLLVWNVYVLSKYKLLNTSLISERQFHWIHVYIEKLVNYQWLLIKTKLWLTYYYRSLTSTMPQLNGVKSLYDTCISVAVNSMQLCVVGNQPAIIQSNQSTVILISCVSWKLLNLLFYPKVLLFFFCNSWLLEIISALRTKGYLKRFIGLLAVPHLETLDLNCWWWKINIWPFHEMCSKK
jgi:hypothetical protein